MWVFIDILILLFIIIAALLVNGIIGGKIYCWNTWDTLLIM